jgi:predicted DsbA family dithiol-disulfide isomerase
MTLTIDVISDVICPWCFIGKRRLEKAVAAFGRELVQVRWHPFQLNLRMPTGGRGVR